MTLFVRFVGRLGGATLLVWVIGGYPLYLWGNKDLVVAAAAGCAICLLNALIGGGIGLWAKDKGHRTFMLAVFGGTGLRLGIVLILFLIGFKLVKLHLFGLTLSLFLFYILFQILEIQFLTGRSAGASRIHKET